MKIPQYITAMVISEWKFQYYSYRRIYHFNSAIWHSWSRSNLKILDFSLLLCNALCNDNGLHIPFSFPLPLTICNLPWWVVFTKIAFWMQWTLKSISQQRQDILLQAVSLTDLHQPTSNRDNNVFKYKKRLRYFTHHKLFLTVAHPNKEA